MIKKALCAILVLSMLLSSIAVTGFATGTPSGGAGGGGTGSTGGGSSVVEPDVTFDISTEYQSTYGAGVASTRYANVVKIIITLKGLDDGEQINLIRDLKLTFDPEKATALMKNKLNKVLTEPKIELGDGSPYTDDDELASIQELVTCGDGYLNLCLTPGTAAANKYIVGNGEDKHLLTCYIQITDPAIYGTEKTDCLDIEVVTTDFVVSKINLSDGEPIKAFTYEFTPENITVDLREEMTGVTASGDTVTYDGEIHNIKVTGAPEGSTIIYTCDGEEFTGAKDAGEYEVTATVECPGFKPLTLEPKKLIINPKELTANVVATDREYNGTNVVDVTVTLDEDDIVTGDNVAIANAPTTGTMVDKHVDTDKEVTIATLTLEETDDAKNYTLIQPEKPKVNIGQANVTFKGKELHIKTNQTPPAEGEILYDIVDGQIFTEYRDSVSGNFMIVDLAQPLVAKPYKITNKDVTIDDGNGGLNYNINYSDGVLDVVELNNHPNPTLSNLNLTYGQTQEINLTLEDVDADKVTVKTEDEDVIDVSYDKAGKMTVTPVKAGSAKITVTVPPTDTCEEKAFTANVTVAKKPLTYTVTAQEKIYNGDNYFVANVVLEENAFVNNDDVEVECIGATFGGKDVGEYTGEDAGKVQLKLIGTDAGNYVFANENSDDILVNDIPVTVVPMEITATVEPVRREYDGTTIFDAIVTLHDVIAADEEHVTATATGELISKNVGTYDANVTVSLSGDACGNYVLAEDVLNTSVEIYEKVITATVTAEDKIYDGYADIKATAKLTGVLTGDTVTNSVVADVYSKNAATYTNGHAIVSLAGTDADNYELAVSEFNDVVVTISPKELTVTGLTATNRVTDETTIVALTGGALEGIVEDDDVTATMPTEGTIADALAGNDKAVTIEEIILTGTDAGNYTLVQPSGITVNIYAPAATPTYRPSYSIGGGSSSSTVTPDKTDENKEDNKEEAKDENKEDNKEENKEEVKEETTTDYTKATATVTLKEKASEIRFISTDEEGKFNPDVKATRNEVVNALNEVLNITDATGDCELNDIEDSENAKIVELFTKANIIAGYDDGSFRGNDSITRAEFVKILTVALGVEVKEFENDKVSDVADHWSKNFVNSFVELGYILGYPDGTFRPDESISRAEVVIIVNRVVGKDVKNADNTDVTVSDMDDSHWAYEYIMASVK